MVSYFFLKKNAEAKIKKRKEKKREEDRHDKKFRGRASYICYIYICQSRASIREQHVYITKNKKQKQKQK